MRTASWKNSYCTVRRVPPTSLGHIRRRQRLHGALSHLRRLQRAVRARERMTPDYDQRLRPRRDAVHALLTQHKCARINHGTRGDDDARVDLERNPEGLALQRPEDVGSVHFRRVDCLHDGADAREESEAEEKAQGCFGGAVHLEAVDDEGGDAGAEEVCDCSDDWAR